MENNGRGIFYGVIGVATLVVAIIGATFAYFAAAINGNEGKAAVGTANVAGTLEISEVTDTRDQLIPTTTAYAKASYVQTGSELGKGKCKGVSAADHNSEYDLCSTYTFTLTNSASVAQQVYIKFAKVTSGIANLHYCVFEDTGSTSVETKACGPVPTTEVNVTNVNIAAGGNKTYTLVFYVNETNGDQTSVDAGASFTGTIKASTSDGTNNLTGVVIA